MIRVAAFDIDGTLFDPEDKQFVPSAIRGLKKLQERGILIILATGRPPLSAIAILKEGIIPDYIICANGHLILGGRGEILKEYTFDMALAAEVYDYCKARGIGLLWKYPDKVYEYIYAEVFENFYGKTELSRAMVVKGVTDIHMTRQPNGGNLGCDEEAMERFNKHFYNRCVAVRIDELSSDLMLQGVNKKSSMENLLDSMGISGTECIAFGDNMNDLEILSYAGIGVCMGNGSEELKVKADYVTSDLRKDGIWKALCYFGLIDDE